MFWEKHVLSLHLAPFDLPEISYQFIVLFSYVGEGYQPEQCLCWWRLVTKTQCACVEFINLWSILLMHGMILWKSKSVLQESLCSFCPHTVCFIFPVLFLCLLGNWSRKLNQQKHHNLLNIFADSVCNDQANSSWDARKRETVSGRGLDCCAFNLYLSIFKPSLLWNCILTLCLGLRSHCNTAHDLLGNVLVLPLLCLFVLSASLVLAIMFDHMRSHVTAQTNESYCYEKNPNPKMY